MNYYKLISGSNIIGVGSTYDFRKFQKKHRIILFCDEREAQYIQYKDALYHDNWMLPVKTDLFKYEMCECIQIEEDEYNTLKSALEVEEEIIVEPEPPVVKENEYIDPVTEITVDYIRRVKVAEMKNTCNKTIENGIDVVLSDGENYHFSLTTQDQLNLITISSMIAAGSETIAYHADGQLCKYFNSEDMQTVIAAATSHITKYTTYYNALHYWILQMKDIDEITGVYFGIDIPDEFKSEVMK